HGEAGRVAWHLTPLIARPWGSWSLSVAFNPLNRQSMAGSWSGTVAFNPLNRQAMEECWSRSVAFNPLNRQAMGKLVA
ncbi:hypothetical protein, partial [Escherichia coli]|uniref:hypothetical protein n=1 Tax=Escherichia coli TaxID=562 RepID=UPI0030C72B96